MVRLGLAVIAASILYAQNAQPPRLTSPEVLANGQVTFRLWAPNASDVKLSGDWMGPQPPSALTKSEDGVWSVSVGPLSPNGTPMDSWSTVSVPAILPAVVLWHPRTGSHQAGSLSLVHRQSLGNPARRPKEPCITKRISPSCNSARAAMLSTLHRHIGSPRPNNIAACCCCPGRRAMNSIGRWVKASLM